MQVTKNSVAVGAVNLHLRIGVGQQALNGVSRSHGYPQLSHNLQSNRVKLSVGRYELLAFHCEHGRDMNCIHSIEVAPVNPPQIARKFCDRERGHHWIDSRL